MKYLLHILMVVLITLTLVALVTRPGDTAPPRSDLASRINAACKGSTVYDWTTGDEYTPVPAGTVKVTCVRKDQSLYYVAVTQ